MIKKRVLLFCAVMLVITCLCGNDLPQPVVTSGTSPTKASDLADGTFFPLGFMLVRRENLGLVAAGGFNVAHRFAGRWEIAEAEDYLNQAEAVGLGVIMDLLECRAYETDNPNCEGISIWNEQEWSEYISTLSTHENLVAWYLPDEIDDYKVAADLYEWVKKYDPCQRPVYGNPGTFDFEAIQRFPAFSDFIWGAWYPEYYGGPRVVVTYGTKLDAAACQGTDTRWGAILQFFDSASSGRSGGYPTPHELRCDSYQAIIAGATGLWYFAYEHGKDLDGLLAELETIADEIIGPGKLDEVILSSDVPQTVTQTVLSGPTQSPPFWGGVYDSIQTLQKEHQGTYLLAVNIATDTVVVEFGNLQAETDTVEVLFESRTIPITDDSFSDTFAQDDVHIYVYTALITSLTIAKTDSPDPVAVGNTVTYTITITNNGPSVATGVTFTDTLLAGVTFGSVTPSQGNCSKTSTITCNLGTLTSSAIATVTVVVTPTALGTITNTASVTSNETDPNMADNTVIEDTTVNAQTYLPLIMKDYAASSSS